MQSSVAPRANHKLSYKSYGPFPIIAKVNDVAYEFKLPPQAKVHPVFHASQLRRALLPGTNVSDTLPTNSEDTAVPIKVLQTRWRKKNGACSSKVARHSTSPGRTSKHSRHASHMQRLGVKPLPKEEGMLAPLTTLPHLPAR